MRRQNEFLLTNAKRNKVVLGMASGNASKLSNSKAGEIIPIKKMEETRSSFPTQASLPKQVVEANYRTDLKFKPNFYSINLSHFGDN
jgi:hypothetical protein